MSVGAACNYGSAFMDCGTFGLKLIMVIDVEDVYVGNMLRRESFCDGNFSSRSFNSGYTKLVPIIKNSKSFKNFY